MRTTLRFLIVSLVLLTGAGCGDDEPEGDVADDTTEQTSTTEGGDTSFCEDFAAVGASMAPDLSGDASLEQAYETAFTGALTAANRMRASAPAEIADAVESLVSDLEAAVAVIERYGWDPTRASVEGTPDEQAALSALDVESDAQRTVTDYVSEHC